MYFETFNELINMAGHGGYVWSAYALSLLVIIGLFVFPAISHRKALKAIALQAEVAERIASNEQ